MMGDIEEESEQNSHNISGKPIINDGNYQSNKVVFAIKFIVIIMGSIFLLSQAIQLLRQYFEFNTSVSVHYEYTIENEFPSFTICLPAIVDKQKLIRKYPDLEKKLSEAESEDQRKNILTEYLDKTLDSMIWKDLSITEEETFNCSLSYWPLNYLGPNKSSTDQTLNCRNVVKPIEYFGNNNGKCFTFFSQLESGENFSGIASI
jgi:hypothetical protein